jgi:hypothetical protein
MTNDSARAKRRARRRRWTEALILNITASVLWAGLLSLEHLQWAPQGESAGSAIARFYHWDGGTLLLWMFLVAVWIVILAILVGV